MAFDIKLYEYNFGNDYEDSDNHSSIYDVNLNFDCQIVNYNLTPMNSIENYTFKVPNNNGLLWKGMSYSGGEIVVDYLITKGTGTSIEQNVSDFIYYYLGYYSQSNSSNKFDKRLVLVNSDDYSNQAHLVVIDEVNSANISNHQSVVSVKFLKLEPSMISRVMYTSSNSVSSGSTITLNTTYLSTIDTPPYITITFNASCTNPVLTATDNTYIRLVEDFSINDTVIINCESKTITINGANGLYALDYSSSFFNVNDNNNTIDFTTSSGGASTSVNVNWYNRWIS